MCKQEDDLHMYPGYQVSCSTGNPERLTADTLVTVISSDTTPPGLTWMASGPLVSATETVNTSRVLAISTLQSLQHRTVH